MTDRALQTINIIGIVALVVAVGLIITGVAVWESLAMAPAPLTGGAVVALVAGLAATISSTATLAIRARLRV